MRGGEERRNTEKKRRREKRKRGVEHGREDMRRDERMGGREKKEIKRELSVFTSSLVYFLMTFFDTGSHKEKSESITQKFKFPLK